MLCAIVGTKPVKSPKKPSSPWRACIDPPPVFSAPHTDVDLVDEGQPLPPPPPFAATAGLRQGVEDMQKFVKEYAAQSMIKKDAEYDVSISLQYLVLTTTLNVCDRCSRKSMMACVPN